MPTLAEEFGIDPQRLLDLGAFNMPLQEDARFYIEPRRLEKCKEPEFKDASARIYDWFAAVIDLLRNATPGDKLWNEAHRRLNFPETPGLMLGLSDTCGDGRGVGDRLAERMLRTMRTFIEAGAKDPALLGVMVVVEDGMGPDRISDIIAAVLEEELVAYSHRIYGQLGIPGRPHPKYEQYSLPVNPCNKMPLLLVPRYIVRDIETQAPTFDDLFGDRDDLRAFFNKRINEALAKKPKGKRRLSKNERRDILMSNVDKLADVVKAFREQDVEAYDFKNDPANKQFAERAMSVVIGRGPYVLPANPTQAEFHAAVLDLCNTFKDGCENKALLRRHGRDDPLPEKDVQRVFQAMTPYFARQLDIHVSKEPDQGRGPADFTFSRGHQLRTVVEVKLASNEKVRQGYEVQVGEYAKAEDHADAIYVVVAYDERDDLREDLEKLRENALRDKGTAPDLVFVDARPKASASKYRPEK